MSKIIKFEVGRTYQCRSFCDYDCIYSFEVLGRSDKFVQIKYHDRIKRRKIRISNWGLGGELCEAIDPHGRYSMSPVLHATDRGGRIG